MTTHDQPTPGQDIWTITDTVLEIPRDYPLDGYRFPDLQRLALVAWLEHHGGDPMQAPLANTFVRLVDEHAIEYDVFERDADGRRSLRRDERGVPGPDLGYVRSRHRLELDEVPLPFPAEFQPVLAWSGPMCSGEPGCAAAEHMLCCPSLTPDDIHDEQHDTEHQEPA